MLYKTQTRKTFTGKVAAIVTRFDGLRASYSEHPNRAAAFFHAKRMKAALTRRYNAARQAHFRLVVANLRADPSWPVAPDGSFR